MDIRKIADTTVPLIIAGLTAITIAAALASVAAFTNAYVFSYLWAWFITPVFGVAVPALYILFGLMLTIVFLGGSHSLQGKSQFEYVIRIVKRGAVVLAIGWLAQAIFA